MWYGFHGAYWNCHGSIVQQVHSIGESRPGLPIWMCQEPIDHTATAVKTGKNYVAQSDWPTNTANQCFINTIVKWRWCWIELLKWIIQAYYQWQCTHRYGQCKPIQFLNKVKRISQNHFPVCFGHVKLSTESNLWNLNRFFWKFHQNVSKDKSNCPRNKSGVCREICQFNFLAFSAVKEKRRTKTAEKWNKIKLMLNCPLHCFEVGYIQVSQVMLHMQCYDIPTTNKNQHYKGDQSFYLETMDQIDKKRGDYVELHVGRHVPRVD